MPQADRDTPVLLFYTASEWRDWLCKNSQTSTGVWVRLAKKNAVVTSLSYDQALEEALCFGWIDSLLQKYDEQSYIQKFSPRRPGSVWSKRNTQLIEQLTIQGRMHEAGLAAVKEAKQNGRWENAYDKPSEIHVPEDFLKELESNPKAKEFFKTLNKTNIYTIAWRLQTAKKPETRQQRMRVILAMLSKEQKFH